MNAKIRQYYLTCEFLWYVLSAVDYLLEDMDSPSLSQQYEIGCAKFDDLAEWLLDELHFIEEREGIDVEGSRRIRSQVEGIVLEWIDRIRARSQDVEEGIRASDMETGLCYLTYGWSLRILSEFDRLIRNVHSPELRQRYQEAQVKFEDLAEWLRNELSWVLGRSGVAEEEAKTLQAAMEMLVEQLAIEWWEKVHELAKA